MTQPPTTARNSPAVSDGSRSPAVAQGCHPTESQPWTTAGSARPSVKAVTRPEINHRRRLAQPSRRSRLSPDQKSTTDDGWPNPAVGQGCHPTRNQPQTTAGSARPSTRAGYRCRSGLVTGGRFQGVGPGRCTRRAGPGWDTQHMGPAWTRAWAPEEEQRDLLAGRECGTCGTAWRRGVAAGRDAWGVGTRGASGRVGRQVGSSARQRRHRRDGAGRPLRSHGRCGSAGAAGYAYQKRGVTGCSRRNRRQRGSSLAMTLANSRKALPRWLIASFSAGLSSALVRSWPSPMKIGS